MPMLSTETTKFLNDLLNQVTLNASAPDFEEVAQRVVIAKQELDKALHEVTTEPKANE